MNGRVGLRYLDAAGGILGVHWVDGQQGEVVIDADGTLLGDPKLATVHVITENVKYPVDIKVRDPRSGRVGSVADLVGRR